MHFARRPERFCSGGPVALFLASRPRVGALMDRTAARQQQIEAPSQSSPKRKLGKKRRELHPRTLLRALGAQSGVSEEGLRSLIEEKYVDPVVSLYLTLEPQKVAPEPKALLRSFHSLKTRALETRKDFIDSLSRTQRATLDHDIKEMEAFLGEYFAPQHLRSLVIFRSGEKLNQVIGLLVPTSDTLNIDPDPYITPLEAVLEYDERVLFVETSKEDARFLIYQLGRCQQVERIQDFVPTDTVDKSIPHHAQQHRLTHLQQHLKHVAGEIYRCYKDRACDAVILMAEHRIAAILDEYLHDELKPKIVGRIYDSPDADSRNRTELIRSIVEEHRSEKEARAIEDLANYKPGEELITSLPSVIDAANLFRIRRLFVSEGLFQKGFVCKEHHYLSLNDGKCPLDDTKLLPVENVVDELVEFGDLHGVDVLVIEHRQDLLAKYGGVAALQYPAAM